MADLFLDVAGTVKVDAKTASTYTTAAQTNSIALATYFDSLAPTWDSGPPANDSVLRIGGAANNCGWIAINETIGIKNGGNYTFTNDSGHLKGNGDGHCLFKDFDVVRVSNVGGSLPAGLAINTPYWITLTNPNDAGQGSDFHLSTSRANAIAGTFIAWTNAGSGTTTVYMRSSPPGHRLYCDGGHWNPVFANYFPQNQFPSGILWCGDSLDAPVRVSGQGTVVDVNGSFNMFIPQDQPYSTSRARTIVQMRQHNDDRQPPCSGNVISVEGEGFVGLVTIDPHQSEHCDTTRFGRLASYNCISHIVNRTTQAVDHSVGEQWYYVPQQTDVRGVVNDYQLGGRFRCTQVSMIGDQGALLHRIGPTGADENQGSTKYDFVGIDKAVTNGSKQLGRQPLGLLDDQSPRSHYFKIDWGMICHGNEDLSREWYNYDPADLIVQVADPTAGQIKKIRIDLPGLGAPSQALYGSQSMGLDLTQQLSSGITVGEALILAANRGSHAVTNFANTKPIAARTYKIGTFKDGRYAFDPECNLIVGQQTQIWLECSKQVGDQWLDSIDGVATSDGTLVVTDSDVIEKSGTIGLDATDCEAGAEIDVTFDIHPKPGQTLPGILRVNVAARAITD